ncbi:MAG: polysaccharide biosynthesis protein [Flavobacteriaceae bacterium]|nr:polysaccharide biosynthesis protein [Flavobacteriaceae bacterium]
MKNKYIIAILKESAPRWLVLIIDCYIVANSFVLAHLIRFNFDIGFDKSQLTSQLVYVVFFALISFFTFGSYKGIIRHTGIRDAFIVSNTSLLLFFLLLITEFLNRAFAFLPEFFIPLSIIAIHLLLNIVFLVSSRYFYKELYDRFVTGNKKRKRVLIYGAGEAGLLTYSVLKNDNDNQLYPVAFADDDVTKVGKKINGVAVIKGADINEAFILKKRIDDIIISIQNIKPSELLKIADKLATLPVNVKIVPPIKSWIDGDLNIKQIKSVHIEDLLGRDLILLDNPILKKEFHSKTLLVTGAAGSIGGEISKQLTNYNCEHLVLVDQAESDLYNLQQYFVNNNNNNNITTIVADVRDKNRMDAIFKQYQPTIIFHAAAYKHVPYMEDNPYESVNVNILGTKIIADLAVKYEVDKFVMISTDKAVNPANVMGATKRIAEMYITCLNKKSETKFITTRFGNVLGSNGSVIPLFKEQIERGGPLTVTHKEINRYFMTIPEACQLVLEAGAMGDGGEIYVFDMGESVKIYDLAKNMIRLSGLKYPEDIDIKITGLRSGEKIYEELLADDEQTSDTYHEKIMIANVKHLDVILVKERINNLCILNKELDFNKTVRKMKEIVPEFVSNNSQYEVFDAEKTES